MADDPNPALRAELTAALAVLDPQIRGMEDLKEVSISDALKEAINQELMVRSHRRHLIRDVLGYLDSTFVALQSLQADGYPDLPKPEMDTGLLAELQEEDRDIASAVSIFGPPSPATALSVDLGAPTGKSKSPT